MLNATDLLRRGGEWLGRVRSWMQSHKHNGSRVTWGSDEVLLPHVTVREVEEIGAYAAAAALNEDRAGKALGELLELIDEGLLKRNDPMTGEEGFRVNKVLSFAGKYRAEKVK